MLRAKLLGGVIVACAAIATSGCTSISDKRGYMYDPVLTSTIQPGIDNQKSVEGTLGRPTFISQFGQPTWYYVSSMNARRPFTRPSIRQHDVLAVTFDPRGEVIAAERTGIERVVYLSPESDKTPTLGRERSFLEDLFGNIGAVGSSGAAPGGGQ